MTDPRPYVDYVANEALLKGMQKLLHAAPEAPQKYFPKSGEQLLDKPFAPGDMRSIEVLDTKVGDLDRATLYVKDTADVRSYEDQSCGDGCTQPMNPPEGLNKEPVVQYLADVKSEAEAIASTMANRTSGDTVLERFAQNRYGPTVNAAEKTANLGPAFGTMVDSANHTGTETFNAFRGMIKRIREDIAYEGHSWQEVRWHDKQANDGSDGFGSVEAKNVLDPLKLGGDQHGVGIKNGLIAAQEGKTNFDAAAKENTQAISAYRTALGEWVSSVTPNELRDNRVDSLTPPPRNEGPPQNPLLPLSPVLDPPVLDPPVLEPPVLDPPVLDPGTLGSKSLQQQLDELIKAKNDTPMPQIANPFGGMGGGSPFGGMGGGSPFGGMGGGSPFGGMDGGSPFDTGIASEPGPDSFLDDNDPEEDSDEEDAEEKVEDEAKDEEEAEEEAKDAEEPVIEGAKAVSEPPAPGTEGNLIAPPVTPAVPGEPAIPGEQVANPPLDAAKDRTVDVGNGRMVEFPNAKVADTVRSMVEAGTQNPKTVYMAASEAGVNLPPMGQDIGSQVPPSLLREGDVVSSTGNKMGMYLGNGEVLMEGGEVKPLSEVATFDGPNQGYFRLNDGGMAAPDSLTGPMQPVEAQIPVQTPVATEGTLTADTREVAPEVTTPRPAQEAPAESQTQVGTPGVPSEGAPPVGDTSAGAAVAQSDSVEGLNPATAFPS